MKLRSFLHASIKKRHGQATGQGLVEFALVIPILLTLIFGLFEAGRAVWVYTSVAAGSREAARLGSSVSDNGSGTPYYLDCDAIRAQAKRMAAAANVTDDDVTIWYQENPSDEEPGLGYCPVSAGNISVGDRVVVKIVGHFTPAAAMPLFTFPTFDITSETRRTIIKEARLSSTGTSATTATQTNTPAPPTDTPTITLTPSDTPPPTNTPTPGPVNTDTPTVTPSNVQPPVYLNVSWTQDGDNCKWLLISIGPNAAWGSDPGYGPSDYKITWTGSLSGSTTIPSNYPNDALWETWQTLNNGYTVNYSFVGMFTFPLESLPRDITLQCVNGTLIQP